MRLKLSESLRSDNEAAGLFAAHRRRLAFRPASLSLALNDSAAQGSEFVTRYFICRGVSRGAVTQAA